MLIDLNFVKNVSFKSSGQGKIEELDLIYTLIVKKLLWHILCMLGGT